jgi:hypothetical protein
MTPGQIIHSEAIKYFKKSADGPMKRNGESWDLFKDFTIKSATQRQWNLSKNQQIWLNKRNGESWNCYKDVMIKSISQNQWNIEEINMVKKVDEHWIFMSEMNSTVEDEWEIITYFKNLQMSANQETFWILELSERFLDQIIR